MRITQIHEFGVPNSGELEPADGATEGHWFFEGSFFNEPELAPIDRREPIQIGHFDNVLNTNGGWNQAEMWLHGVRTVRELVRS